MEIASERTVEERSNQDKVDEEVRWLPIVINVRYKCVHHKTFNNRLQFTFVFKVFKKAYIPRTLNEVAHYERDVDIMLKKKEESSENTQNDNVHPSANIKLVFGLLFNSGLKLQYVLSIADPLSDSNRTQKRPFRCTNGRRNHTLCFVSHHTIWCISV